VGGFQYLTAGEWDVIQSRSRYRFGIVVVRFTAPQAQIWLVAKGDADAEHVQVLRRSRPHNVHFRFVQELDPRVGATPGEAA
jgi:hypothetical protein